METMARSSPNVVKIRVQAVPKKADLVAGKLITTLEEIGYEVIEWSGPFQCKPPEADRSFVYISGVLKQENENGNEDGQQ